MLKPNEIITINQIEPISEIRPTGISLFTQKAIIIRLTEQEIKSIDIIAFLFLFATRTNVKTFI